MNDYYPLLLALGTLAVSSGLVILVTDVISIVLYQSPSTSKAEVLALVSSTFHGTTLVLMTLLVFQFFIHHKPQHSEKLKPRGYLIVFAGTSCIISSGVTALQLVLDKTRKGKTPLDPKILRPPESLVLVAVISGAASIISQCIFVICLASLRRKKRKSKSILSDTPDQSTQMSRSIYTQPSITSSNTQQKYLCNFRPTNIKLSSLKHHSLKIVEKFSSTRFSLFSIQKNPKSVPTSDQLSTYQFTRSHTPNLLLLDRNNRFHESEKASVDINPSQSVESLALPSTLKPSTSFKFLETIPASPTDPSGGEDFRSMLPQNPQPLARRNESTRSFSPANSYREPKRYSRSPTPVEINRESHIHPLFRTDSSDPPSIVTPGTIVTAAPGAGKVISNRASLRSLRSKKSGSSLQSRRKNLSSSENFPVYTESENRGMLQLQEPLPSYGVYFEASN
ncbi:hypothetical protein OnM2_100002 [Erysiphe neolycopersici]|uniref:Uncharacterized protein n=1 Tax=Erysiphe neolycopersici TaxID=212602 RepID=A0A420H950_9PEZI|nr:hypothetical protein OnM2_100002 [Erysiphe neolycopersici]